MNCLDMDCPQHHRLNLWFVVTNQAGIRMRSARELKATGLQRNAAIVADRRVRRHTFSGPIV